MRDNTSSAYLTPLALHGRDRGCFCGIVQVGKGEDAMLVDVGGEDGDGCSRDAGGQHDGVWDAHSEQV